ncbi:P-loop containing nucleoside triphosphate hydrolase protein [Lasiosphaeria ovina]|uniref:P-loop containing nucleoside triphosphate hydrolase protein n=1 Tax=Lasiosphaeria ovina TaxID=92902 RepID=A0AAE0MY85_9PEZI|nr:P-loop containing nucleoside triphosphate hydrolase protein [Lasiosphaeria ovina]
MAATPDEPLLSRVVDDKSPICIPFILSRLETYKQHHHYQPRRPFIIGLNGVQGVGKTTLVRALAETLRDREGLSTLVVSIDDFYLSHADQLALAAAHPDNALVQYRGEPGTHDMALAKSFFSALCRGEPAKVPRYDKAAFSGLGDRLPETEWTVVNTEDSAQPPVQVIIFEGWCVGFRALDDAAVEAKWKSGDTRTLHSHTLEHLLLVNSALRDYDAITDLLDVFIHVDAEDTQYVYDWRLEQEAQLRRERGTGMPDEQVVKFVDAYYPAYELFSDGVRRGIFYPDRPGCQLRLVVGRDRTVKESIVI